MANYFSPSDSRENQDETNSFPPVALLLFGSIRNEYAQTSIEQLKELGSKQRVAENVGASRDYAPLEKRAILTVVRRRNDNGFPYKAQVLDRSFAILDVLAESSEDLGLADLEEKLELNKSTSYRLLRTLERHRFAERDFGTGKYRLGSKLLELGARAVARFDLVTIGRPFLEKLSAQSGETAHLGVLSDREVVSIAVSSGRHNLRMSVTVGGKAPVHCSSLGKAILALLPEEQVDLILGKQPLRSHARNTITRRSNLKLQLGDIRTRGFAIDNEELEDGLKCIGAGVQDYSGRVVGALSIAGAALRFNKKRVSTLAPLVARTASEFSFSLGYRPNAIASSNGQPQPSR